MAYNPDIHHRRTIRLQKYDYSSHGAYFITICAQGRQCQFGEIEDGALRLNDAGVMVAECWNKLPERFPNVTMDEYVVMPNHFHGIILLNDFARPPAVDVGGVCPHVNTPNGTAANSLSRVIQAFKSLTSVEYVRGVRDQNWLPFSGRLWQRNYYERVIRDYVELSGIGEYIKFNLVNWAMDDEPRKSSYPRKARNTRTKS